jgi:hypothetical protein
VQRNGVRYRSWLKGGRLQVNSPAPRIPTPRLLLSLAVERKLSEIAPRRQPCDLQRPKKLYIVTLSQTLPEDTPRSAISRRNGPSSDMESQPRRSRSRQSRRLPCGSAQWECVGIPRRPKHRPIGGGPASFCPPTSDSSRSNFALLCSRQMGSRFSLETGVAASISSKSR